MNKLSTQFIEKIKLMPETGMGYNKVKAILSNGETKIITVLNCSLIQEDINIKDIIDIQEIKKNEEN